MNRIKFKVSMLALICFGMVVGGCSQGPVGMYEGHLDVGKVAFKGSTTYDENTQTYTVTGSGENIWDKVDGFHFAYNKVKGDIIMEADVSFPGPEELTHKKAGIMIRQDLSDDSAYADAMYHGDGLICLQYRLEKGGITYDIPFPVKKAARIRLVRAGDLFSLEISDDNQTYQPVGAVSVKLKDPVYAGLAVSSHNNTFTETAVFSNLKEERFGVVDMKDRITESTLEIMDIETGRREIVYRAKELFEAPNWTPDGKRLIYNKDGRIYSIPVTGGTPTHIDTDPAIHCNNDHGITADGKTLIISDEHEGKGSMIYTLPLKGGTPKRVTDKAPSYWHGVSPDGKTLAYCAERNGQYDIYTIPIKGGAEKQLTDEKTVDDGPEYSSDGKYIYFNSARSGMMKIWRMNADGTDQRQMTFGGDYNDWFAHPSPDNKNLVFISYDNRERPGDHLPNKDVTLRLMSTEGGEPKVIAKLFGGQGTINVPSWSPDSKKFAFVSYRLLKK